MGGKHAIYIVMKSKDGQIESKDHRFFFSARSGLSRQAGKTKINLRQLFLFLQCILFDL